MIMNERNPSALRMYGNIWKLAWPAVIEQTLVGVVGIVATVLVGRIGTVEIAAVGLVNMIVTFLQSVFTGLSTGTTVVIAHLTGEGKSDAARHALKIALLIGIFLGIVMYAGCRFFHEPILNLFLGRSDQAVLEAATKYYKLVLIGLPFLAVDMVIAGAQRGAGNTRNPMVVTGIVNIINASLGIILIFGIKVNDHQIIPAMGVVGAGLAVTVSRFCGAAIRVVIISFSRSNLKLVFKKCDASDSLLRIVRIGIPAFVEQLVTQGGILVMQSIIASIGTMELAAFQVGANVTQLAQTPINGIALASTTIIGQTLGNKDFDNAKRYARYCNILSLVSISTIAIATFLFAKPLAGVFSKDAAVINMSMIVIYFFVASEPFLGITMTSSGMLRAAGDTIYVTFVALFALWVFRVLVVLLINKYMQWGIIGVMIGVCMDYITRGVLFFRRVDRFKWSECKV